MKIGRAIAVLALLVASSVAEAQTSYPMLMSAKPIAVQQGQTAEITVQSRYNLFGAYQVLVTGEGVAGEPVLPEVKQGEKPPTLTQLKIKFTAAAEALPGVREFRVATPQGVSTVGQLVVVRDPVVVEARDNDKPDKAQKVALPAALCGAFEKAEDLDFYQFDVAAGTTLNFHVRSQRLEDKIHDLQVHSDPIITIRNSAGTTLAASDNVFFADPALSYRFEQAGAYLLEIRDVRYQGNQYWEYCVEVSSRPMVNTVYPLAVPAGADTTVEMVGLAIPSPPHSIAKLPSDSPRGIRDLPLAMATAAGEEKTDPVSLYVTDLPLIAEASTDNNAPAGAQAVSFPVGINGRLEAERDIDCYSFEAKKGDAVSVQVMARRLQSSLDAHVRIVDEKGNQLAQNDDARLGVLLSSDAWIESWTAPADGKYFVEIRDLHLRGGPAFVYYIELTKAEPYFTLRTDMDKTQLSPGTCGVIFARVERKNGFAGPVQLEIEGLPPSVTASCGKILADRTDGCIVLQTAADAAQGLSNVVVRGVAAHAMPDGSMRSLVAAAQPLQETYMPGGGRAHWPVETHAVAIGAKSDIRSVTLSTHQITLKPGQSQRIDVKIERSPDYTGNITLDVIYQHLSSVFGNSLPQGVTLDLKNSKTLLTAKETEGHITLKADDKAPPCEKQQIAVMANVSINFVMKATYAAPPVTVAVEKAP
ncbi:MAG: PPC domain-containing protein [Planctomycetia bacterium]|nr:PPC domain-containing protein [Planctomycetia bacterium]